MHPVSRFQMNLTRKFSLGVNIHVVLNNLFYTMLKHIAHVTRMFELLATLLTTISHKVRNRMAKRAVLMDFQNREGGLDKGKLLPFFLQFLVEELSMWHLTLDTSSGCTTPSVDKRNDYAGRPGIAQWNAGCHRWKKINTVHSSCHGTLNESVACLCVCMSPFLVAQKQRVLMLWILYNTRQ